MFYSGSYDYYDQYNLELKKIDVNIVFLYGYLEEIISMEKTWGFVEDKLIACLLKKYLYGLTQRPEKWYLKFDELFQSHDCVRSGKDTVVYAY